MHVDRVDHIELYVPDRYEAARLYEEIFGFEVRKELEFRAIRSEKRAVSGVSLLVFRAQTFSNSLTISNHWLNPSKQRGFAAFRMCLITGPLFRSI
jgi:catechol 2,3-dioxygenase-like lactoylglutathione lyase family enzyme